MQLAVICNCGMQLWGRVGIAWAVTYTFVLSLHLGVNARDLCFNIVMQKIAVQPV